jgi:hypothetical protein
LNRNPDGNCLGDILRIFQKSRVFWKMILLRDVTVFFCSEFAKRILTITIRFSDTHAVNIGIDFLEIRLGMLLDEIIGFKWDCECYWMKLLVFWMILTLENRECEENESENAKKI